MARANPEGVAPEGRIPRLPVTGDAADDLLLEDNPWALLLGMLLDQQIPIAWAFRGPARLADRIGDNFTVAAIAAMDPEALTKAFCDKPALHRYPAVMAGRTQELCHYLVEHHDGDAGSLWRRARSAPRLYDRLVELPGFGPEKAQIFIALLAKRFGVTPKGWREAAGAFADDQPRSVADIGSAADFERVKAWKKQQKAQGKTKSE